MYPRGRQVSLGSVADMLWRTMHRLVASARAWRVRSHVSIEDVLTSLAAVVLGAALAVPLIGWDTTAPPAAWALLVVLSTGPGALVAGLRSLWSDERAIARAARRRQPDVRTERAPCTRRRRPVTRRTGCRHAVRRRPRCPYPRTPSQHSSRHGIPVTPGRVHGPRV
jgi:hypothetical protein